MCAWHGCLCVRVHGMHACVPVCVSMCMGACVCMHACVCVWALVCVHGCLVCACMPMCVYMHAHVCTYTYTCKKKWKAENASLAMELAMYYPESRKSPDFLICLIKG